MSASLVGSEMCIRDSSEAGLWPIPPPGTWGAGAPPTSGRRRQRWARAWVRQAWLTLLVLARSRLEPRQRPVCPPSGRSGRLLN
eukprot:334942-Alexandrium_andersonii.AAC.1